MNILEMSGTGWVVVAVISSTLSVIAAVIFGLSLWRLVNVKIAAIVKQQFCQDNGGHDWVYSSAYQQILFEYKCSCGAVLRLNRTQLTPSQVRAFEAIGLIYVRPKEKKK